MAGSDSFASMLPQELPRFAKSVDKEKYKCVKCRDMLRPPVRQTQCGHRLCSICLEELLRSGSTICPGQDSEEEECVDLAIEGNVAPDFGTERDLKKLPVLCDFQEYGCSATPAWSKKAKHVEECNFRPVSCTFAYNGCPYRGKQSDLVAHLKTCEFALINCKICGKDVLKREYKKHEEECLNKPQRCRIVGKNNEQCSFTGKADALIRHITNAPDIADHVHKLNDRIAQLESENSELREKLQRFAEENEQKTSAPAEANPEFQHKILKNQAKINERVYANERTLEEKASTELVVRQSEKLSQLQDVSKMHESRISRMEQGGHGGGASEDERNKLRSLESTVGMHDIRLAEYDLRFQCMESAGYDGVLIWKIKDYTRRKNDAISGRTLSLYSQPFYTARPRFNQYSTGYRQSGPRYDQKHSFHGRSGSRGQRGNRKN